MAKFLFHISYTLDGIKGLKAEGGTARTKAARKAVESLGGTMESHHYALGDADAYLIADFPGPVDAAAVSMAVCAGGGARSKTITLLTPEEMDEVTRREVGYQPPKG